MKTLYETLKNHDKEKIISEYIYTYGPSLWEIPDDSPLTAKEIKERLETKINNHIDFLLSHSPKPDPDGTMVLLAHHVIGDTFSSQDIDYCLVNINEEEKEYGFTRYGYEFDETEIILGFYISDAYTTQYYLTELLANVIHETSFFGWEREGLEEEKETLERRYDEVKSGEAKTVPADEVFKEIYEETGWIPEKRDKEEKDEEYALWHEIYKYNMKTLKNEIEKTKE